MHQATERSAQLAAFLYKLESIRRVDAHNRDISPGPTLYGLLLTGETDGTVAIDGSRHPLQPDTVFLLAPDAEARLTVQPDRPADGLYIRFHALRPAGQGHFAPAELPCPERIATPHAPLLLDLAREAERRLAGSGGWDAMEANIRFQEMIRLLFEQVEDKSPSGSNEAIQMARRYMERNYSSDMTRERLAAMAGMNADYFSRAFKRQFRQSPNAYLNDIRISRAKELLLQSGEPIRSVAQHVGFSDEFYFSRKFKAKTGYSPAAYVKRIKHSGKIASLNHLITGHLVALGHEPYAAIINNAFPVAGQLNRTIAVGQADPDLDKLVSAKPDLIVERGTRYAEKTPKEKLLSQIAPTITLPYAASWRSHLLTIARCIGKEKEADGWLERYESKAERLGKQLRGRIGGETLLILGIGEGKLCVYGQRNIGTVLYGDLGLSAPEGVLSVGHYRVISPDDLPALEADRILLTIFRQDNVLPSERAIRDTLLALNASRQWQSLKAVRAGAVYGMYDSQHLYTSYNPLSHSLLLDKTRQLFL